MPEIGAGLGGIGSLSLSESAKGSIGSVLISCLISVFTFNFASRLISISRCFLFSARLFSFSISSCCSSFRFFRFLSSASSSAFLFSRIFFFSIFSFSRRRFSFASFSAKRRFFSFERAFSSASFRFRFSSRRLSRSSSAWASFSFRSRSAWS